MWADVQLPLWAVIILGLAAALAVLDRLLLPTVRYFLRRRLNRAIDRLNASLKLQIPPFKLARRSVLIDRLLFDTEVLRAIEDEAATRGEPREVTHARAKRYAQEIVPAFSATTYFRFGTRAARRLSTMLYRVRLAAIDEAALAGIGRDQTVIFVINHRSNMDYVLVTYMVSASSALSYAVGEWARVWLLQSLIRAMGGYFVRRDSSNPLYRKVLARYVAMATDAGVTQAVFPEGRLTRDGALQPAKLGLLSYMVSGFDPGGARDIVFVPVGVNYDRVLEDRVQIAAGATPKGEKARFSFSPGVMAGWLGRNIWLRLRGRWHRYGYAAVGFGRPISLKDYMRNRAIDFRTLPEERRFAEMERLGDRLIGEVGQVVPALPVSLVASAFAAAGGGPLSMLELKASVHAMMRTLQDKGAHVHIPRSDQDYAVDVGLRMLTMRHLVVEKDGLFNVVPAETAVVAYYANSIGHLVGKGTGAGGETPAGEAAVVVSA